MPILPSKIWRAVEWRLRNNDTAEYYAYWQLQDEVSGADRIASPHTDMSIIGRGQHGDPTAKRAMRMAVAGERVEQSCLWGEVIDATYALYKDTATASIATMIYKHGGYLRSIAKDLTISIETVKRHQEKFMTTCALLAVEKGLVAAKEMMEELP